MTARDVDGTELQPGDRVECVRVSEYGASSRVRFAGRPGERFTVAASVAPNALNLQGECEAVNADRFRKVPTLPDATEDGYDWPTISEAMDYATNGRTILAEAEANCYGPRGEDYGHPREDFTRQAILWTGLLQHKLADGEHITPEDVGRCMVAVKLARDVHSPKRDNRVDGAGYFLCLDRLETGQ